MFLRITLHLNVNLMLIWFIFVYLVSYFPLVHLQKSSLVPPWPQLPRYYSQNSSSSPGHRWCQKANLLPVIMILSFPFYSATNPIFVLLILFYQYFSFELNCSYAIPLDKIRKDVFYRFGNLSHWSSYSCLEITCYRDGS